MINAVTEETIRVCRTTANQPFIKGKIKGYDVNGFIDTGATISLIKEETLKKLPTTGVYESIGEALPTILDVNGNPIEVLGVYNIKFSVGKEDLSLRVFAVNNVLRFNADILLGYDSISENGFQIDFANNFVKINHNKIKLETISLEETFSNNVASIQRYEEGKSKIRARSLYHQIIPSHTAVRVHIKAYNAKNRLVQFVPNKSICNICTAGIIKINEIGNSEVLMLNFSDTDINLNKNINLGTCNIIDLIN